MGMKGATAGEMFIITQSMVTQGEPGRDVIERYPGLKVLFPTLESAHKGVAAVRVPAEDPKLQALSDQEAAVDAQHDDKVRGIHTCLTGLALLCPEQAVELQRLRDWMFPDGLQHTNRSYRGEAGHAAMLSDQLKPEMAESMKAVRLHNKTLFDALQEYFALGKQLADMEDECARLTPPTISAASANAARNAWIRAVNALVAMADMIGLTPEDDRVLFSAMRDAEQAIGNRNRSKPAPAPAPATDTTKKSDK
jgi:hypothetical protein